MSKKVVLKMANRGYGSKFDGDVWEIEYPANKVPKAVIEALKEQPTIDEDGYSWENEQVILDWIDSLPIEEQEKFYNSRNEIFPFLQIDSEDWIRQEYKMQELRRTKANVIEIDFSAKKKSAIESTVKKFN